MPNETTSTDYSLPPNPGEFKLPNETDPFWLGQAKVNGKLCRVDWSILQALRETSRLLKAEGANVAPLNALINKADKLSAEVALENPPGCVPTDRGGEYGGR